MLKLQIKNNSLEITDFEKKICTLRVGGEYFCVGNSQAHFKMNHGSFKIKDKVKSKLPLIIKSISLIDNTATLCFNEGNATVEIIKENLLLCSFNGLERYNRLWIALPAKENETVYGSGETFSEFNLRGKRVNVWVAEHINALQITKKLLKQVFGIKNTTKKQPFSKYETYYAQPTFLSSRKYFYHSTTTDFAEFDFTDKYRHIIKTHSVSPFYLGFGESFEDVLGNLSYVLGNQPVLPDWVYNGQILGVQGGTDIMLSKLKTARENGIDVCGIWIQDWVGRRVTAVGKQLYWNWECDNELYPNLKQTISDLKEQGVRVLGYCNPFLAIEKPLYEEASRNGYLVKDKKGKDYLVKITTFPAAMVDFTNPKAWEWLKNIIKTNIIDFGFSGYMADFGEYLPTDCVLYSGEDASHIHNTWPSLWAKLNREAVEESGKLHDVMFFTRSGFSQTPMYSTMMWNGDNHVDFSFDFGLPSVIPAMLSLTTIGFGLSHSDIGGYTTLFNLKRSEEVYMRWCEMNAFTPVMRGHEGLNPDLNIQFDSNERVLSHGSVYSKIHTALKPYIKSLVEYNSETGVGVVRPLFFYYNEKQAFLEQYEYLLGREILVAPVLRPNETKRQVYLPDDTWILLETGEEYKGGTYSIPSPLGQIPVFVRKNAPEWVLETVKNLSFGG